MQAAVATLLEARIDEVLDRKIFPTARAWCLAAKLPNGKPVSERYLGTLKSRLRSGVVSTGRHACIEALARAAGVTGAWLTGEEEEFAPRRKVEGKDPLYGEFVEAVRTRHGLAAALALEPNRWHMTTVLRAMAYSEPRQMAGEAVRWWTDLLDGVEAATRHPVILGTGDAVLAATLAQLRSPLPSKRRRSMK